MLNLTGLPCYSNNFSLKQLNLTDKALNFKGIWFAKCSLVMSLFSCDFLITELNVISSLALSSLHSAWILDGRTSTCH